MITVVVDRDSVAAGDDANPHATTWEFPDDARVGDVVLRIIDARILPAMRNVTWIVSLVDPVELRHDADDRAQYVYDGSDHPVVALMTDADERPGVRILPLSRSSRSRLTTAVSPTDRGEYVLRARYLSNGALTEVSAYREHVTESDEAEQARYHALLHETWPDLYDEHGNRRT